MSASPLSSAPANDRAIYIDIDDVLSQTLPSLTKLLAELHGLRVDYEEVTQFNLLESFGLDSEQLDRFFECANEDSQIRKIPIVEGAPAALQLWSLRGYQIHLLTGRPPGTEAATRRWLSDHEIPYASLAFVDKYGRAASWPAGCRPLSLEDVAKMNFRLAVEDSLEVAAFLLERWEIEIALMDRPWNRDTQGLAKGVRDRLIRCRDWSEIMQRFPAP